MPTDNLRNNLLDNLNTNLLDFHQRRITNAAPSVDDNDYVVRKELKQLSSKVVQDVVASSGGLGYDKCTFGLAVNTYPMVANNVCPPWIASFELQPIICYFTAGTFPTGAALKARIKLNGVEFFTAQLEVPASGSGVYEKLDFTADKLNKKDILTCDITQIGSTIPGINVVIVIKFKIIGA